MLQEEEERRLKLVETEAKKDQKRRHNLKEIAKERQ
jgi:hypothetical protein